MNIDQGHMHEVRSTPDFKQASDIVVERVWLCDEWLNKMLFQESSILCRLVREDRYWPWVKSSYSSYRCKQELTKARGQ